MDQIVTPTRTLAGIDSVKVIRRSTQSRVKVFLRGEKSKTHLRELGGLKNGSGGGFKAFLESRKIPLLVVKSKFLIFFRFFGSYDESIICFISFSGGNYGFHYWVFKESFFIDEIFLFCECQLNCKFCRFRYWGSHFFYNFLSPRFRAFLESRKISLLSLRFVREQFCQVVNSKFLIFFHFFGSYDGSIICFISFNGGNYGFRYWVQAFLESRKISLLGLHFLRGRYCQGDLSVFRESFFIDEIFLFCECQLN
ncbi:hypothetical protein CR513_45371, partial [Mucuna pruriens]